MAVRPPAPRIKKPKKPVIATINNPNAPTQGKVVSSTPHLGNAGPATFTPTPYAQTPAGKTANAIRTGVQKPPETTAGAQTRSAAQTTYTAALKQGRGAIVQAALKLGSPEIINALKADPNFAEFVGVLDAGATDPASQMAQSQKNEGLGLENLDQQANQGNTYFSGIRLKDRGQMSDQYANERAGFSKDYTQAFNDLIGSMGTAKGAFEGQLGTADEQDLQAYLAANPEPTGPDTGTTVGTPAATPAAKPVAGFKYVQDHGPRAGMSFNLKKIGSKTYKVYANGERIPV